MQRLPPSCSLPCQTWSQLVPQLSPPALCEVRSPSAAGPTTFTFTATAPSRTQTSIASSGGQAVATAPAPLVQLPAYACYRQDCSTVVQWHRSPDQSLNAPAVEMLQRWEKQLERAHHRHCELKEQRGILSRSLREAEGNMRRMRHEWRWVLGKLEDVSQELACSDSREHVRSSSARRRDRRAPKGSSSRRARSANAGASRQHGLLWQTEAEEQRFAEDRSLVEELADAHAATLSMASNGGWSPELAAARHAQGLPPSLPAELTASVSEHCQALAAHLERAGCRSAASLEFSSLVEEPPQSPTAEAAELVGELAPCGAGAARRSVTFTEPQLDGDVGGFAALEPEPAAPLQPESPTLGSWSQESAFGPDSQPEALGALQTDGDCLMAIVDSLLAGVSPTVAPAVGVPGRAEVGARGHAEGAAVVALASTVAADFLELSAPHHGDSSPSTPQRSPRLQLAGALLPGAASSPLAASPPAAEEAAGAPRRSSTSSGRGRFHLLQSFPEAAAPRRNLVSQRVGADAAGEYLCLLARSLIPRLDLAAAAARSGSAGEACSSPEALGGPRRRVARHCLGSLAASVFARLAGQGDAGVAARECRRAEDAFDRLFVWSSATPVRESKRTDAMASRQPRGSAPRTSSI